MLTRQNARTSEGGIPCPECGSSSGVTDSRPVAAMPIIGKPAIRRRRACMKCDHRWTTYETAESDLSRIKREAAKQLIAAALGQID